jgi:cysteine desulfurase
VSIYLDHAATTPVRSEVIALVSERLAGFGNPSSVHRFGQDARRQLEQAREEIAAAINCDRNEVIFTSGGTEADNLAIKGLFESRNKDASRPIVISVGTEHHAVLEPMEWLEGARSAEFVTIPVNKHGILELGWLDGYLAENGERVALISAMWANNETGVVNDIPAVAALGTKYGVPVHSDAVAAMGHTPVDFAASGLAAMSFTGHKLGAPVGIGALIVGRRTKLLSLFQGGSQERNLRPGTQDGVGAAALALATNLAVSTQVEETVRLREIKSALVSGVLELVPDAIVVGDQEHSLPNIVNFVFPGCAGDSVLFLLDAQGVAISNGSACSAGVTSASHVLTAMGFETKLASGCVRVSMGYTSTRADIDGFLAALPEAVARAKKAGFTL